MAFGAPAAKREVGEERFLQQDISHPIDAVRSRPVGPRNSQTRLGTFNKKTDPLPRFFLHVLSSSRPGFNFSSPMASSGKPLVQLLLMQSVHSLCCTRLSSTAEQPYLPSPGMPYFVIRRCFVWSKPRGVLLVPCRNLQEISSGECLWGEALTDPLFFLVLQDRICSGSPPTISPPTMEYAGATPFRENVQYVRSSLKVQELKRA